MLIYPLHVYKHTPQLACELQPALHPRHCTTQIVIPDRWIQLARGKSSWLVQFIWVQFQNCSTFIDIDIIPVRIFHGNAFLTPHVEAAPIYCWQLGISLQWWLNEVEYSVSERACLIIVYRRSIGSVLSRKLYMLIPSVNTATPVCFAIQSWLCIYVKGNVNPIDPPVWDSPQTQIGEIVFALHDFCSWQIVLQ